MLEFSFYFCRLANESDGFRLVFDEFIGGNAGDALKTANGRQFSTHDNDRDNSLLYSCARLHKVIKTENFH